MEDRRSRGCESNPIILEMEANMSNEELNHLKELFEELKATMKKYGTYGDRYMFYTLCEIVDIMNSDLTYEEKKVLILSRYDRLYIPHGGLAEFYIELSDEPKKMRELNISLGNLKDEIATMVKKL